MDLIYKVICITFEYISSVSTRCTANWSFGIEIAKVAIATR